METARRSFASSGVLARQNSGMFQVIAVLRGPDAGDQRGVAGVGDGGDDAGDSFGVSALLEEAAEVGHFGAVSVGGGYVVRAHAIDGDDQEDGRGIFLGRGEGEPKELCGKNGGESKNEADNFWLRGGFIHIAGKNTANLAGIIAEMRKQEKSSTKTSFVRKWGAHC